MLEVSCKSHGRNLPAWFVMARASGTAFYPGSFPCYAHTYIEDSRWSWQFVGLLSEPISLILFIEGLLSNGLAGILIHLAAALDSRDCHWLSQPWHLAGQALGWYKSALFLLTAAKDFTWHFHYCSIHVPDNLSHIHGFTCVFSKTLKCLFLNNSLLLIKYFNWSVLLESFQALKC